MKKQLSLALGTTVLASSAFASSIVIGIKGAPSSIDPQFHNVGPNNDTASLVFEELAYLANDGSVGPRLATSWKNLSGNRLEINLRKGVKFTDGSDFTANDVLYTICRMRVVKNSPSRVSYKAAMWKDVEVVNDHKIIVQKSGPEPLTIPYLTQFHIISDSVTGSAKINFNGGKCDGFKYAETVDYDRMKHMIGTGPYMIKEYVKGEKMVYVPNKSYWNAGGTGANMAAVYDSMELRPIKNAGSRVAALLAGDVDMIEAPSSQDLERLGKNDKLKVVVNDPVRSIYIMTNVEDSHDKIKGTNGKNPFQDKRVRQALSYAIDRDLLVKRVLGNLGSPAKNIAPQGYLGINPNVNAYSYDPKKAKALLAEAGYPNGFEITLGAPNDRYLNDAKVAQAIAQMWARIGIKVNVEAVTRSLFFGNRNKKVYPVWLAGWGSSVTESTSWVTALAGTVNKEKKWGASNKGGYSNPKIDALLDAQGATDDLEKRRKILEEAASIIHEEMNFFATHIEHFPIALKKSVDYSPPKGGERTYFRYFKPAK